MAQIDMVNHPPHYSKHPSGVECIEVTERMNFNTGNAVKYLWRADEKWDTVEDLKKANWYVRREFLRVKDKIPKYQRFSEQWSEFPGDIDLPRVAGYMRFRIRDAFNALCQYCCSGDPDDLMLAWVQIDAEIQARRSNR